jgi:F-type H+-transporting ATPase subunit gamma
MALSIRQLKNRIRNIENVHKITSAMEMISVSKLRTQQRSLAALRDYFFGIEGILNELVSGCAQATHPLLEDRKSVV